MVSVLFSLLVIVAAASIQLGSATAILNSTSAARAPAGILSFPLIASHHYSPMNKSKRGVTQELRSPSNTRYLMPIMIGQPVQDLKLAIEVKSSYTWVNPDCSKASPQQFYRNMCYEVPRYNLSASQTASEVQGQAVPIRYPVGSVKFHWVSDTITFGQEPNEHIIPNQFFGVADASQNLKFGVLGLGRGIEATRHMTLLDNLVEENLSATRAFSIAIGSRHDEFGSIIFGGINLDKFAGSLAKIPLVPREKEIVLYYTVFLQSITLVMQKNTPPIVLTKPGVNNPQGLPVSLDTGEYMTDLPHQVFEALLSHLPAVRQDLETNQYLIDCAAAGNIHSLQFIFEGKTINVFFDEFVLHDYRGCILAFRPVYATSQGILGLGFLGSAYVVYDQDNQCIHMAQGADCGEMNYREITPGPDGVPSTAGECLPLEDPGKIV